MVFKRATLFAISCLLFGATLLAWQLGIIDEKDFEAYRELASLSNLKVFDLKLEPYSAKQERYKIVKEFYIDDAKDSKKLVKLKSHTSSLFYEQKEKGKEIVEKMNDVVCLIQEDVYALLSDGRKAYKQANGQFLIQNANSEDRNSWLTSDAIQLSQNVQRIQCARAVYHYQNRDLDAENVIVERFILPGDVLPDNFEQIEPFFFSTAASAVFSLNKGISFNAKDITAQHRAEEFLELRAKEAAHSDRHIALQGDMQFKHTLGIVFAQKADIILEEHSQISNIHLQDSVELKREDGSWLTSSSAIIDCVLQKGSFSGEDSAKVCYYGAPQKFYLESKNMSIGFDNANSKQTVNTLTAEQEVAIHYGKNIRAYGDFASYCTEQIGLKSLKKDPPCKVVIDEQNHIFANSIEIHLLDKIAIFHKPEGFLNSREEKILFNAETMIWNDNECCLTLRDNVEIEEPEFGFLQTDGPVAIYLKEEDGKKRVSKICCEGESFFVHVDEKKEEHHLTANGKLIIDHEKHVIEILSEEGEQLIYKDHHGSIMANSGFLYYDRSDKKPIPQKLLLEGDVCIVNQFTVSKDNLSQYIIADIADYSFQDRELTLSQQKNRVLFYDKINQIELSAPALKIKRDAISDKDSVRGVGDVRFVFAAQELEKIRRRFRFNETVAKDPLS